MRKGTFAKQKFLSGYNCSQAVACAFADEIGIDETAVKQLTIGFGGGMGRMREVCGTVSGAAFVLSALYGKRDKNEVYKMVQEVAEEFRKENGSVVCRELLGLSKSAPITPTAEPRTKEYYKKRPCAELVEMMADILEKYIKNMQSGCS